MSAKSVAGTAGMAVGAVGAFIGLAIQLGVLNYLVRLERIGCKCAMDWRRTYMMVFLGLSVLFAIVTMVSGAKPPLPIAIVWPTLGFVYVVCVLQYVHRLKKEKCACSESVFRDVMEVLAYLYVLLLAISIVFIFMAMLNVKHDGTGANAKKR